jgi:anti-sigma regulatory factor (Ser/Thr protein kinase)
MSWDFPAVEALGDAAVVVEVLGPDEPRAGTAPATSALRLVHLNRQAEKIFELEAPVGPDYGDAAAVAALARAVDVGRLHAVAASGHPDRWISRLAGGWYELRAAPLVTPAAGPDAGRTLVLLVARDLGSEGAVPGKTTEDTRGALLLEISRRLGAAVRENQVAQVFFDLICPAFGAGNGRLAVAHADGEVTVLRPTPSGVVRRSADPVTDAALTAAIRGPGRQVVPAGQEPSEDPTQAPAGARLLAVPLRAGASTVGAMGVPVPAEGGRAVQEFVDTVAALVAQAVQRARLFDAQAEASLALQHALLPPVLPEVEGLELAARYRPGSGHEVGGDWYDVVPLPSGWVAFVIGDVQGHDLPAAALMGQIRSVVRAYLLDDLPPSSVLSSANAFLLSLDVDRLVTVCIALVHPRSRLVTLATAGHACPMLIIPGRSAELLEVPHGPPLGVLENVICRERTTPVAEDATLVLYTDGLIERRHRAYEAGEQRLLSLVTTLADVPADRFADAILELAGIEAPTLPSTPDHAWPGNEDDTALLLLRWRLSALYDVPGPTAAAADPGAGNDHGQGNRVRTLPVTPASAVIARWYVDDLLRSWQIDAQTRETAVLLTDEVVANAVRHAHRTIRLDVSAERGQVRVETFDDSHREPSLGERLPEATSGRGLQLVDALATEWGVRTSQGDLGKTVWFTVAHPA